MAKPFPLPTRFSTAGLANAAADELTEETGRPHEMAFRPRSRRNDRPFIVIERKPSA